MDRWYEMFLEKALYPCVRVHTTKAGGSGQVVHSSERNGTFVLTCEHVIDSSIEVKEEWSAVLQRNVKRDVRSKVYVDFFKYSFKDRAVGATTIEADIVAYDKNEDIALLRLNNDEVYPYVADIEKDQRNLRYFDSVLTIGAALGHPPICTRGNLCGFNDIIDNRDYMLSTAAGIYGNSGGATFLEKSWTLIGMPARIAVTLTGFMGADAITHMMFIIPFWRIQAFFREQMMLFMLDDSVSYQDCERMIEERRKKSQLDELLSSGAKEG
ncbi:MAG: hypothetical protein DRN81_06760 [Thermoproteota archaeon]|nr:MAG: hypothetical protein DRN81_06760 [Candidatus Korarchaeota archaeon]